MLTQEMKLISYEMALHHSRVVYDNSKTHKNYINFRKFIFQLPFLYQH